jgi:hypothetical protein
MFKHLNVVNGVNILIINNNYLNKPQLFELFEQLLKALI